MNRSLVAVALVAAMSIDSASAQDKPKADPPKAEWGVFGVSVGTPGPADADRLSFDVGTRLHVSLRMPAMHVVGIAADGFKFDKFVDDLGTDLQKADVERFLRAMLRSSDVKIAPDGDVATLRLHAHGWPKPGATKIQVKGTVVVLVGKEPKGIEKKNVLPDQSVDLEGGILSPQKITGFGNSNFWRYRGEKPLKSLSFHAADETRLDSRQSPGHREPSGTRDEEFTSSIQFSKKFARCTVRAEYFTKVERIEAPIDLEVGLGLK